MDGGRLDMFVKMGFLVKLGDVHVILVTAYIGFLGRQVKIDAVLSAVRLMVKSC